MVSGIFKSMKGSPHEQKKSEVLNILTGLKIEIEELVQDLKDIGIEKNYSVSLQETGHGYYARDYAINVGATIFYVQQKTDEDDNLRVSDYWLGNILTANDVSQEDIEHWAKHTKKSEADIKQEIEDGKWRKQGISRNVGQAMTVDKLIEKIQSAVKNDFTKEEAHKFSLGSNTSTEAILDPEDP